MNYQQTILEAGKEVSDALHLYDATNRKLIQDKAQIEELEKAVTYTNALFQSGRPLIWKFFLPSRVCSVRS